MNGAKNYVHHDKLSASLKPKMHQANLWVSFSLGIESATFLHQTEKKGVLIHATDKRFF